MAEYDLAVKSSLIVTPGGRVNGQLAVRREKIVAILSADKAAPAKRTLDVGGQPVIPGLIDTHCHFRDPGYTHKEDYGYHGKKGALQAGADADFVVLEDHEEVLHADHSHYMCGWTPSEDFLTKGRPVKTVLRGRVIMEDGNVTAEQGSGRLLTPAMMA